MFIAIVRRLVGMLPLLFLVLASASAQPLEPCMPDCFDTPWETSLLGHATNITCGGHTCRVTIWYRKRTACGNLHDVNLVAITKDFTNPGCEDACSFDDLIRECTRALLMENPMGFSPRPGDYGKCDDTWRISSATCWHLDEVLSLHPTYYACNFICCLARYRVCQVDPYVRTYELLDSYSPEVMPVCEFPCFLTCAVALPPYPKMAHPDIEPGKQLPYPNPARSSVAIPYSIPHAGAVLAIIRGVDGREVARSAMDNHEAGNGTIAVDVSGLPHGSYLYTVECDGRQVASGPLTIAW